MLPPVCSQKKIWFRFRLDKSKLMAAACRGACLMGILVTVIDSPALYLGVGCCQSVGTREGGNAVIRLPALATH